MHLYRKHYTNPLSHIATTWLRKQQLHANPQTPQRKSIFIDAMNINVIIDTINSINSIDSIAAFKLNKNIYHRVDRDSGDSRNYRDKTTETKGSTGSTSIKAP